MVITPWLGTLWGASDADPSPETEPLSRPTSLSALCLRGMVGAHMARPCRARSWTRPGKLGFVKIDVEGFELHGGLQYMFRHNRAMWCQRVGMLLQAASTP